MGDACLTSQKTVGLFAYWLTKNNKDGSVMRKSRQGKYAGIVSYGCSLEVAS